MASRLPAVESDSSRLLDAAQQQLEETQRALAEAQKIEAIGKLTLGLAHDFNNLLTIVINSLDLIALHAGDRERIGRLVDGGLAAAERGVLLTRQLLAFGRGQNLAPELHDVNQLLLRWEEIYRRAAGADSRLEFELDPELPPVRVDATQLQAALFNLVINAVDAMPQGGEILIATAWVRETRPDEPGGPERDYVRISVADTGIGMSRAVADRAMEPFFTTKPVGHGSGLGLSQVFGFSAQSGGFARLQSRLGTGTRASIFLPVAEDRQ